MIRVAVLLNTNVEYVDYEFEYCTAVLLLYIMFEILLNILHYHRAVHLYFERSTYYCQIKMQYQFKGKSFYASSSLSHACRSW